MFNFLKRNKANTPAEKPAHIDLTLFNKPFGPQNQTGVGAIEDDVLDRVSGGLNPQPLPPRSGRDYYKFPIF